MKNKESHILWVTKPNDMYSPNISKADIEKVRYYKKYSKSPLIRKRMEVLYLRWQGLKPGLSAQLAEVHQNTVTC